MSCFFGALGRTYDTRKNKLNIFLSKKLVSCTSLILRIILTVDGYKEK